MKKIFTMICLAMGICGMAQVKIGAPGSPNPNAVLELDGTGGKGLLLPRVTKAEREAMTNVPPGLMVYQTDGLTDDAPRGLYYCLATSVSSYIWAQVSNGGSYWSAHTSNPAHVVSNNSGNIGIGTGTGGFQPVMKLDVLSSSGNVAQFGNAQQLANNVSTGIYLRQGQLFPKYTGAIIATGISATEARLGLYTGSDANADLLNERLSISNAGFVGIGDTMPIMAGLVVNKRAGGVNAIFSTNAAGIAIESDNPAIGFNTFFNGGSKNIVNGYSARIVHNPANGLLNFNTTNAFGTTGNPNDAIMVTRMSINPTGNIGIGTTTPTLAGLVVNQKTGAVNAMFGSNTSGVAIESDNPSIAFNAYYNGGSKNIADGYSARITHNPVNGLMSFNTTTSSATAGSSNDANMVSRMSISASGNVGINTVGLPLMNLHVSSPDETIALFENTQPLDVNIKSSMYLRTGNRYTGAIKTTGTANNAARLGFYTSASLNTGSLSESMSITDEGNVGIGNTAPNLGGLLVDTKVGAVNAMFGSNTSGVAIESSYPGIGFNSYFSNGRKSINTGFGSLVGQDPVSGRFYIQTSAASVNGQGTTLNTIDRLNILPNGNIGVQGNTNPQSPLSFSNSLGEKINFYDVNANASYGIGIQGAQMQFHTGSSTDAISFGYGSSTSFTEKLRMQNGYLTLTNGRIRLAGQLSAGNTHGIEFTNLAGNAVRGFLGQYDDNNMGLFGYGGAGWGLLWDVNDGALKIGTTQKATGYMLNVGGKIIAEEVRVQLRSAWPDYVFSKNYKLHSLNEIEKYITANNHLPNVPAAADIEKSGIALGEMQTKMMEKIEELTLYVIDLKKEIEKLKSSK